MDLDSAPTARAPAGPHRELAFASLTGDYRYLLQRPRAFSYSFRRWARLGKSPVCGVQHVARV